MYGQEAHTASSKGKGGLSKSTALMKQMSGFRSENLCDSFVDEDRTRDGNCSDHICKYCERDFPSGRALGGHMRAHGSLSFDSDAVAWNTNHRHTAGRIHEKLEQLSCSGGHGGAQPSLEYDPDADSNRSVSNSSYPGISCRNIELDSRAGKPNKIAKDFGHPARSSDDPDASGGKDEEDEEDASIKASANSVIYSNGDGAVAHGDNAHYAEFDNAKSFSLHSKAHGGPLYTLRRNPKPSKRLVDQEYAAMEALQQASTPIAAVPLKKSVSSNPFSDKACACTECGKEFSSSKALFGHMRCHPEREWRGIQRPFAQDQDKPMDVSLPVTCKKKPPPSPCEEEGAIESESDKVIKQFATSDENSDAESIEAAYMNGGGKNSLQSWMKGKRSKRSRQVVRSLQAVTDNAPFNVSSEIKEDTDMANCLVMLACASRSQKEPPQMKKMRRTASLLSSDFDRRSHSGDVMHKNSSTISDQGHLWSHSKDPSSRTKPLEVNADDGSLCEGVNEETATDLHVVKTKYECGTCKRIFKSHQALGGHRASHKKVKGCFARTHASDGGDFLDSPEGDITDVDLPRYSDEECLPASASKHGPQIYGGEEKETTSYGNKKPGINKRMKGHECSICRRVFPSGQALGGHKRCHWGGAGSQETSNVPVSSSSHQQQAPAVNRGLFQRTGREELLDLNLPAPEEEYEDYYMDFRLSSSALQLNNQLTTKSISDENNIITAPKSPGEFFTSANDVQLKLTDSMSNGRGEQFLYPGLKQDSAQETASGKTHHVPAQGTGVSRNHQFPAQEAELEGSAEREILNNCRYKQCNICDKVFTSVEALGSHHKTHRSVMSSVAAGLTPISA